MYMWYTSGMEVPITRFRREVFALVNKALEGGEVWVSHKGRRLKLVPEGQPGSRLGRITRMEIVNSSKLPGGSGVDDRAMKAEMTRSWERDWERDFGPAPDAKPVNAKAGRKR